MSTTDALAVAMVDGGAAVCGAIAAGAAARLTTTAITTICSGIAFSFMQSPQKQDWREAEKPDESTYLKEGRCSLVPGRRAARRSVSRRPGPDPNRLFPRVDREPCNKVQTRGPDFPGESPDHDCVLEIQRDRCSPPLAA